MKCQLKGLLHDCMLRSVCQSLLMALEAAGFPPLFFFSWRSNTSPAGPCIASTSFGLNIITHQRFFFAVTIYCAVWFLGFLTDDKHFNQTWCFCDASFFLFLYKLFIVSFTFLSVRHIIWGSSWIILWPLWYAFIKAWLVLMPAKTNCFFRLYLGRKISGSQKFPFIFALFCSGPRYPFWLIFINTNEADSWVLANV